MWRSLGRGYTIRRHTLPTFPVNPQEKNEAHNPEVSVRANGEPWGLPFRLSIRERPGRRR
jgi:hypothetical protein